MYMMYGYNIPIEYVYVQYHGYVHRLCVDCTYGGGSKYRPDDWPEEY